ncbi:MAG: hypothetical protein MCM46_12890 [Candidatus Manganitrophus sp. SB1]|nr:hypothetical protein [Candidatus Manganitrophus morganii]
MKSDLEKAANGNRLQGKALDQASTILADVRKQIQKAAGKDPILLFHIRRYVARKLIYDERGTPMQRRALKEKKRIQQANACADCKSPLTAKGAVLDRLTALDGYTESNTRLLCPLCDSRIQSDRGFK